MTDKTQAIDETELAASLAKLGPKTSTHKGGTGNVSLAGASDLFDDNVRDVRPKFSDWAARWLDEHIPAIEEKAATYGSNSLAKKGSRFAAAQRIGVNTAQALELGCAQYAVEKGDRIEDAILRGQLPTLDTWTDIAVYALMAQYIRETGTWA